LKNASAVFEKLNFSLSKGRNAILKAEIQFIENYASEQCIFCNEKGSSPWLFIR
jgi:hypothetical protein